MMHEKYSHFFIVDRYRTYGRQLLIACYKNIRAATLVRIYIYFQVDW